MKSKPSDSKSTISHMSKSNYGTEVEPHEVEIEVLESVNDANKSQSNVILCCLLGTFAILLVAFIIILTKYLKIKKLV